MNRPLKFMVLVMTLSGIAYSCISPSNIEGVAFTNDEPVNFQKIEDFGSEGAHYIKESTDSTIAYRFISRYSPYAIVYLGNYSLSYASGCNVNCMGIVADTSVVKAFPSEETDTSVFDFTRAVVMELEWLADKGIITIAESDIRKIEDSLYSSSNGGVQYWTCCNDVLGYNSWYVYDEKTGVWGSGAGVDGANAVRGVKGVYGGCSVIDPGTGLPEEDLPYEMTGALHNDIKTAYGSGTKLIIKGDRIKFTLQEGINRDGRLSLVDMKGKTVLSDIALDQQGKAIIDIKDKLLSGVYILKYSVNDYKFSEKVNIINQ